MATQPAVLGKMRLNNARLGYNPTALARLRATRVRIYLNGALANNHVRRADLTIRDVINETPSTCNFTVNTTAPSVSHTLRITINSDTPRLLFNGVVQKVSTSYGAGKPTNLMYPCSATDDLEKLTRRIPFGSWADESATDVVAALVATFAPGFTVVGVEAGLPVIAIDLDGTEGFAGVLKEIAHLIGGYFYIEDRDVHLFTRETTDLPDSLDVSHPPLTEPALAIDRDLSQLRTRVYGTGHGENLAADVLAGETILPVASVDRFNALGGLALAGTQRIAYTGLQLFPTNGGSFVGPGVSPASGPTATLGVGTNMGVGIYNYVYTFVTAAGETLPSPWSNYVVTLSHIAAPSAPTYGGSGGVGAQTAGYYGYAYTFVDGTGETTPGLRLVAATIAGVGITIDNILAGPSGVTARNIYRTTAQPTAADADIAQLKLLGTKSGNGAGGWVDVAGDGALGANAPASNTASAQRRVIVTLPIGPTGTTARYLYRRGEGINGDNFHLIDFGGIADNTTTSYTDVTPDATIAGHVGPPSSDTSGLATIDGLTYLGATSIEVASGLPFQPGGGWARSGNQTFRYTGVSGNTLTGIPGFTEPGSLTSSMHFGEHIDPLPALSGVTGLVDDLAAGTPVRIFVQRDDVAAQAEMAAIDGGDGIYEFLLDDSSRNEVTLTALCDANLVIYSRPIVTVTYTTHDVKTKSGKPITITNILGYSGTLTIQDVSISEIDQFPGIPPKFTATASSVRMSLEAILRSILG